ncbi:MAG: PaaX domain-containing protein, C- domain protein [Actinophytocola sp.]|uniref:PaaX family transcriptional regulator C-terminal domain-containing protein n=1 Tax=Actinophytocola sp. TaxID=1872138 RepID=UPI00132C2D32|nr:PaaX family transcriptional regulator C-terminal domain-containing protein [Actinophytocola sp.]MPZ80920.1 PaaX domain-containing protein, C- domain protein [Actinophytocola sp.]
MLEIPGLRPLTARSAVLSTLLGAHPPRLPARSLVKVGELFDIAEGTIRVALSRMVAAGDLLQVNGDYELTSRLERRQARQDQSRTPAVRPWAGDWEIAVVTADRRPPAERIAFRQTMAGLRLAELREGTWLRPANLSRPLSVDCVVLVGRPVDDPGGLAASLWDLPAWAARARLLHDALDEADGLPARFILAAAVLRHFVADPLLPAELLAADWPGDALRSRYERFDRSFQAMLRAHLGI